ncbi:hypothetical protein KUTeg_011486 [Tegillarca granosa]|uniref:Uncharacterized protein n=1 Tax=Tegillarca granosa TaxID=220873 RepID=A0ABQ9F0L9_TEGGR|nr:hypothetical protein KUTeg_011486 [Tegillarca granosa]
MKNVRCECVDVDYTVKPVVITTRKDLYTNIWSLLVEEIIGLSKQITLSSDREKPITTYQISFIYQNHGKISQSRTYMVMGFRARKKKELKTKFFSNQNTDVNLNIRNRHSASVDFPARQISLIDDKHKKLINISSEHCLSKVTFNRYGKFNSVDCYHINYLSFSLSTHH